MYSEQVLIKKTKSIYNLVFKRIIDFVLSLIMIILCSPIMIIVSILIVIDSGFPVFYRTERGGYKNINFKIFKFRSMVKNADKIGGLTTALHDPRITKVGRFLRKSKLDEIPQLFNIFLGQMSFVGPRPEALKYVKMFTGVEKYIMDVRPGITDFSSLKFSDMDAVVGDVDVDKYFCETILPQKNALRIEYVSKISFITDFKIFFKTVFKVFSRMFKKRNS